MSAATVAHVQSVPTSARVSMWHILSSEWIKLFAVRSTPWILLTSVVVMAGLGLLMAIGMTSVPPEADLGSGGALIGLMATTFGYTFGQFVFAVLGVMRISGEYGTGQIRSTLTACPTRLPVLAAKAVVVAVTSFVVGTLAVALTALITTPILEPHGLAIDLADSGAQRALLGVPLYLTAIALFALGVGAILRHTAAGIAVVIGILLVLPLLGQIGLDVIQDIAPYLPTLAGEQLITADIMGGSLAEPVLGPWEGYGVLLAWVAVALAGAAVLLRRRDA